MGQWTKPISTQLGAQGVGLLRKKLTETKTQKHKNTKTQNKIEGLFSKERGREKKETKKPRNQEINNMAPLTLQSYFERETWKSWSNLLNKLENPAFRKVFYPRHMNDYNEVIKRVEEQRRISVKKATFQETTTREEREMWNEYSDESVYEPCLAELLNIVHQIRKSDELLNKLFEKIAAMEEKRMYVMHGNMLLQFQKKTEQLQIENQKRKNTQEKRRATLAEKKTQEPLRRSRRIAMKNQVANQVL